MVYGRVAAIRFQPPGSEALAKATAAALRTSSGVIWPLHGMVATGPDPAAALDLVEVVDKAATIALALGEHRMMTSGLTFAQEMAVREAFGRD
jgi:ribulose-5-phosphate 4-epimerase/fuculose-1-phosphate aldolase